MHETSGATQRLLDLCATMRSLIRRRCDLRPRRSAGWRSAGLEALENRALLSVTNWTGDIPNGTVWHTGDVQRITGHVRVPGGATLTIEPGAIIQFNAGFGLSMTVDGTLLANGSANSRVVFTSTADDTGPDGTAGTGDDVDTNGDGSASSPSAGHWNALIFSATSVGSVLTNTDIRYGGSAGTAELIVSGPLTATGSNIRNSSSLGVRINASNPIFTSTTFTNNNYAPIGMDLASNPAITGVTSSGNGSNALVLDAGTITGAQFWNDPDITYRTNGDITVAEGASLTVSAGQVVKFRTGFGDDLIVQGTINADGTAEQPIYFTSDVDDAVGGDTNNNAAGNLPGHGNWNTITLTATSTSCVFDYVTVRYGGSGSGNMLHVGSNATITHTTLDRSAVTGLRVSAANPVVSDITLTNNLYYAATMDLASNPAITGVTISNNGANAMVLDTGTITGAQFWDDPDITYRTNGDVTVAAGATLTVGAGQVVKFRTGFGDDLIVQGTILADGANGSPIYFTSDVDDTVGGDTNNNASANAPGIGNWNTITLTASSTGCIFDFVTVRYGGSGIGYMLNVGSGATISNTTIKASAFVGLRINQANPTVSDVTFADNYYYAASMDLASNPAITGVTMSNNGANAMVLDGGTITGTQYWDDPAIVYRTLGDITVAAGATLIVGAGQVIKFRSGFGDDLFVDGTIIADGTDAAAIVFTSDADDTAGGDTNNNAGVNSPNIGNWNTITLSVTSSGCLFDFVTVRYGGSGNGYMLNVGSDATISHTTLKASAFVGLRINQANPTVSDVTFADNYYYAASMDLASNPAISGVTMNNNGMNGLLLDWGTITGSRYWDDPDITYRTNGDVTVAAGATLTVGAGQVVKFRTGYGDDLIVQGTILADGTAEAPIIFTSDVDDQAGGDTNNNGGGNTPSTSNWNTITLTATSTGCVFDYVTVRYGGSGSGYMLDLGSNATVTHSTLDRSGFVGLRVTAANPTISEVTLTNNLYYAANMDLASNPAISGVTVSGNGVNGLVLDAGTLTGNRVWDDTDIVYRPNGDITVAEGATLTIAPGQVVKFRAGYGDDLLVNGTLTAVGTLAKPIVFTSELDDSIGGETVASSSSPSGGNWNLVGVLAGTSSEIGHAVFRYGGGSGFGMVYASGADTELTLAGSELRNSSGHGAYVNTGAMLTVTNSLVHHNGFDGLVAVGGSTLHAYNNTIDGNYRGVEATSSTIELKNNLITNHSNAGILISTPVSTTITYNDVYNTNSGVALYTGIANQTGLNGNNSGDPLYFNRDNAQYQLRSGSPAIDNADSAVAPTLDYLGNPRFDDPGVLNLGSGATLFVDRGAYERQAISTSDIDLAVTAVSGPTTGSQDQSVTVMWTVTSVGAATATGNWTDTIYLSADTVWTPDDLVLGEATHTGDLGPGVSYNASKSVTLPGVLPGNYFFIVRTDSGNGIFEGVNESNNPGAAVNPTAMDLPLLTLGAAYAGTLSTEGSAKYYKIAAPANGDLAVALDGGTGTSELYLRYGDLPTRQSFDERGNRASQPDQTVSIANTRAGFYYVMVYSTVLPTAQGFSLTASVAGFGVTSVSPARGGNSGKVTINIRGSQFTRDSVPTLVDAGNHTIAGTDVVYTDSGLLSATFDLTGATLGAASIRVTNGGTTTSLQGAFTVVAGNQGSLTISISAPNQVRIGRTLVAYVDYSNRGDTDVVLTPFVVTSGSINEMSLDPDMRETSHRIEVLPVNPSGTAGVLPPGASARIPIYFRATASGFDELTLSRFEVPGTPIDWTTLATTIRPSDISNDEWNLLLPAIRARIGETWPEYLQTLTHNATLLPASQGPNYSVTDLLRLTFEAARADITTSVNGVLVDAGNGDPIRGASITLHDDTHNLYAEGYSLNDGTFVIPGVAPGIYKLQAAGYVGASTITVGAGDVNAGTLSLSQASVITGGVISTAAGFPLVGYTVTAISSDGTTLRETVTKASGVFTLGDLPAGTYTLSAGGGVFTVGTRTVTVGNGDVAAHANILVDIAGGMTGVVRDAQNNPVAGAVVVASVAGQLVGRSAVTDAEGNFTLDGTGAGTYTVAAFKAGFVVARVDGVLVAAGVTTSNVALSLSVGGTVAGTVRAEAGNVPVPYAIVTLFQNNSPINAGQAREDGTFTIADLPAGNYTAKVTANDLLLAEYPVTITSGQTAPLNPTLAKAGTVTGIVRIGGVPAANVFVSIIGDDGHGQGAITDENGQYTFTDLPLDNYSITIGDGFAGAAVARATRTISSGSTLATADLSVDLAGTIRGAVLAADGATPITNATIIVMQAGLEVLRVFPDSSTGRYAVSLVQPGSYDLIAVTSTQSFAVRTGVLITGGQTVADADFTAGSNTVSGVLTGPGGTPIANAVVRLTHSSLDDFFSLPTATTDANGGFTIPHVAEGSYRLSTTSNGFASVLNTVSVPAGGTPTPLALSTTTASKLAGTITDSSFGQPLSLATVSIFRRSDGQLFARAAADVNGQFVAPGLPTGDFDVVVTAPGKQTMRFAAVAVGGASTTLNPTLPASTTSVTGTLTHSGAPVPNALVQVADLTGQFYASARTNESGQYAIDTLPAGNYTFKASAPGLSVSSQSSSVTGSTSIDFSAAPAALDQSVMVAAAPPTTAPSPAGWLADVANDPTLFNFTPPVPSDPGCIGAYDYAMIVQRQYYDAYNNADAATRTVNTNRVLNPDVGLVVTLGVKVAADIASLVIAVKQMAALGQAAVQTATAAANAGSAAAGAAGPLAELSTLLSEKRADLIGLVEKVYSGVIPNIYTALQKGQGPDPADIAALGDAMNVIFGIAGDLLKLTGKLKDFAEVSPVISAAIAPFLGLINTLLDAKSAIEEFSTGVNSIKGRIQSVDNARALEALGLERYRRALLNLALCEQTHGIIPGNIIPPNFTRVGGVTTNNRTSFDPNDIHGPAGYGDLHYIVPGPMDYEVEFENDPVFAEAAAQEVFITNPLDTDLDINTVEFTSFGFGGRVYTIPQGLAYYETTIDLRPEGIALIVPVVFSVNPITRTISATFRSLDPETHQLPDSFDLGFLPINNAQHDGEGFFTYTIRPVSSVITGTTITNQASIVFDLNAPILTPTALNTIDIEGPDSSVSALPSTSSTEQFTVAWTGSDPGAGIAMYDLYVSENNGDFTLFTSTPDQSVQFTGVDGHTYRFYTVARDGVGFTEASPASADQTITVDLNAPPTIASLTDSPDPVRQNATLTLTAGTVADTDGTIAKVEFFRDANNNNIAEPDEKIGEDSSAVGGYTLDIPVTWAVGAHNYLAVATDNNGSQSAPAQTAGNVLDPALEVHVGDGAAKLVTFTDSDGTIATIAVKSGNAGLFFVGTNLAQTTTTKGVTITGANVALSLVDFASTAPAATLTFTGKGGNNFIAIDDINITGSAKSVTGPVNLLGDFTATGAVGSITLRDFADNHQLTLGPANATIKDLTLTLASVTNLSITSAMPIKALTVNSWSDTDNDPDLITAPWIGAITTKTGGFQAGLQLSGTGAPTAGTLGKVAIKGALANADWNLTGLAASITAGSIQNWTLSANNLTTLKAGNTSDAAITLAGAGSVQPTLTFGTTTRTTINSNKPIKALNADAWTDGQITAPWIAAITTKTGAFNSTLTLSGSGAPAAGALGKLTAKTAIGGEWTIAGVVGTITAASANLWSLDAVALNSLKTTGDVANTAFNLSRDTTNPKLAALGTLTVGGTLRNADLRAAGNITSITLTSIDSAIIAAGAATALETLPDGREDIANTASTIASLTVKNNFAHSGIVAGTLGKVSLKTVTTNSLQPFGFATTKLGSYSRTAGPSLAKNLAQPGDYDAVDQFVVRIV